MTRTIKKIRVLVLIWGTLFILIPSSGHGREFLVPEGAGTIQEAIQSAQAGDTIVVGMGEYVENIVIDKTVTLRSRYGSEKTMIKGKESGRPVVLIENTNAVRLEGFSISESTTAGIVILKSTECVLYGNNVHSNGQGIILEYSHENSMEHNIVRQNNVGIRLTFSERNTLKENNVDSNGEKGIILTDSHRNSLIKNTANSNYWNGITLWSSNDNIIKDNIAVKNTYPIILKHSENNQLTGNKTMRRLHLVLPIFLVYLATALYLVERKLFIRYYSPKSRRA